MGDSSARMRVGLMDFPWAVCLVFEMVSTRVVVRVGKLAVSWVERKAVEWAVMMEKLKAS